MRNPLGTYSLERVHGLADDRRYWNADDPEHEDYSELVDRVRDNNFSAGLWQPPEPYRLGGPPSLSAPVGASAPNRREDVAQVEEALFSLDGLGLSRWLPRSGRPSTRLNATIAAFQGLNGLEPDGLINPGGPTLEVLSRKLPLPDVSETPPPAPTFEAAVLSPQPRPETLAGRDLTTRGIGDTLAEARAEAAFEAERRAEDPFGDIFGGGAEDPVLAAHVDKWLAEDAADVRAQRERDAAIGSPNPAVEQANYVIGDAGADRLEPQPMSMNNSQRDQIIDNTMGHEGGKTAGTSYGITQPTLDAYNARYGVPGFPKNVSQLDEEQARQIARKQYYEEYGIGDIDESSVAAHVFDVVFNSGTVGAAKMLQDAMWQTIQGTDLEKDYTRGDLPGSLVPKEKRRKKLRISSTTIDVLNAIIERGLIEDFHNNLVAIRWEYMKGLGNFEDNKGGWEVRAKSYLP